MKRLFTIFFLGSLLGISVYSQEIGTVKAIKANLRGTPSNTGVVMTVIPKGEAITVVTDAAPWYLVQTAKYVGWIHGNSIELTGGDYSRYKEPPKYEPVQPSTPTRTTKPVTSGESSFQREYVGGDRTTLLIVNGTDRLLTLRFGGVTYTIAAGKEREIEIEGGRYEYSASVPRARPDSGVEDFTSGYRFSWRFYIVQR